MLMRIETPVKGYNGYSANVKFVRGVAEEEISEHQIAWFKSKGYSIREITEELKSDDESSLTKIGDDISTQEDTNDIEDLDKKMDRETNPDESNLEGLE